MSTHHTSRSRDENVPAQSSEITTRPTRPLQFRAHFNRSELRRLASFIGRHRDNYRILGQDGDNLGVNESSLLAFCSRCSAGWTNEVSSPSKRTSTQ